MLSVSSPPTQEPYIRKPRSPPDGVHPCKNSFNSLYSLLSHSYFNQSRAWLLLSVLLFQIILFLSLRSVPLSFSHRHHHFPSPSTAPHHVNIPTPTIISSTEVTTAADDIDECGLGRVFVYDLPSAFNTELIRSCDGLNPWSSRCDALENDGFGQRATGLSGIVPESLAPAWYWTDQFVLEIIFHNRILKHKCRTTEPKNATAFYIPFYAGLAVGKFLWFNYTAKDRDRHCDKMLKWVQDQPYYNKSNGWDHFLAMGRISWDFRRSKEEDWGSSCIYMPGMRNITRLLIERNPWDYFDVGVPYPTGFHPRSDADILQWQEFVRTRNRTNLFCFAGAKRRSIKNDFRGQLLSHCHNESDSCRVVDCGGAKCSNGTSAILETFLDSDFCLQPRGDSFTRRSIFDCMLAGSIPVLFWRRTAYYQYEWFLPGEPESYSVFIHRNDVKNGTSVRKVLESYSKEEVRKMREKVIDHIPKFVYARSHNGLESIKDAFDVAIDGVLRRFKEQEEDGYKW
ncbi:hypothetical protein JCGZ_26203 [Jatropha curcas]|uniref:Exostosin GT47 domain-containing protein n=1 Tax=Jatropha curcas TaxID=180498 RepID=A0A067JEW5_JATCU|nr:xyloglucan galactosyltransferase XLT2 [Jatropha curcas]KDP22372.1 hypothetical protein JCGZ_26203 [Jatropha curcas]